MMLTNEALLDVSRWLMFGERGTSSDAIVAYLVHGRAPGPAAVPQDPADFRRCELLLQQVPALRPLLPRLAGVSPAWANLVENWDTVKSTLESEVPGVWEKRPRGSAPLTMKMLLNSGKPLCHMHPTEIDL